MGCGIVVARVDRLAQWIASDILRAEGVTRTPDSMAAVMRVSYRLADAGLAAVGELTREIAAELSGQRVPVVPGIGDQLAELDLRAWEAQFAPSGPPECD